VWLLLIAVVSPICKSTGVLCSSRGVCWRTSLTTPLVEVSKLTQTLKRFTARSANQLLGLTGQTFWQDDSYDHLVRDDEEFDRIVRYIENNPIKAGLVAQPEDFPWSSASLRLGKAD
jgi:hypothetical protein